MEMLIDNIEIVPVQTELDIFGNDDSRLELSKDDQELFDIISDAFLDPTLDKKTKDIFHRILNLTEKRFGWS